MAAKASILSPERSILGEGIGIDPVTMELRWFDIKAERRIACDPGTGETDAVRMPEAVSAGAGVNESHEMLFATSGLWLRDRRSGALEPIAAMGAGRSDLRCNDGRTHPSGAFWCSMMGAGQEAGRGSIHWFRKGELRPLFDGLTTPNAICFSQDGRLAHFSDTPRGIIWTVDLDPATGLPVNEPKVFHRTPDGDDSRPDGAVLDRDGLLYCARWGGGRVDVIDAQGRVTGAIPIDAPNVTCPAFCGPGLSRLAVTTARDGLSPEELDRHPASGATFVVALGCRGRLDPPVLLG